MKKKLLLPIIGMLSLVASAAGEKAHIYEIRPWDWEKKCVMTNEQSSAANPIDSGETFYFVIRMLNSGWKSIPNATNAWDFVAYDAVTKLPVSDEEQLLKWGWTPPEIGIIVSGKTVGAEVVRCESDFLYNPTEEKSKYYTDIICKYAVKPGDLALPVLLANTNGTPITANSESLYILNSDIWKLQCRETGEEALLKVQGDFDTPLEYTTYGNPPENAKYGYERGLDINLSRSAFYVRTADFTDSLNTDNTWYEAGVAWRGVHQGGTKTKRTLASITLSGNPTVATTLYVWSDNDARITLPGGTPETITNKSEIAETKPVQKIEIKAGKSVYTFDLKATGVEGDTANLYLSQFKGHTFTSHTLNSDYLTVPVKVLAPEPPSITVTATPDTAEVPADKNKVSTPIGSKLELNISGGYQAVAADLTVTITPALQDGSSDATNYVHIAIADDADKFAWTNTAPVTVKVSRTVGDPNYDEDFANGKDVTRQISVYGLGADGHTDSIDHTVNFNITHDGATSFFTGGTVSGVLFLDAAAPVLELPASVEAIGNVNRTFELTVKDNYKNFTDDAGYTIMYKLTAEDDWDTLPGKFRPNASGVLTNGVAVLPALSYIPGTFTTTFKVVTPGGDTDDFRLLESNEASTTVTVSEPARVSGEILLEGGGTAETGTYVESDDQIIDIRASLSRAYTKVDALYAFLAPADAATMACVKGNILTNSTTSAGMKILRGDVTSEKGELYIIDGGKGSGTTLNFDIVLCKTPNYDPANVVGSAYQSKTFKLTAKNQTPVVRSVTVDGLYTVENSGDTLSASVSMGVPKKFEFDIGDVAADLKATASGDEFAVKYSIVEGSGAGTPQTILTGDPSATNFTYTFTSSGVATIKLWVRDKDMTSYATTPDFSFKMNVLDYPSISIANEFGGAVAEGKVGLANSKMTLKLSENSSSTPLDVEITVDPIDSSATKPGLLLLGGINVTNKIDSVTGNTITNVYCITLKPGQTTYDFYVTKSDGTLASEVSGFKLTPKVTTTNAVPNLGGKTWDTYYVEDATAIAVKNVAPIITCSLGEENVSTNGFKGAIGNNEAITWSVDDISDIDVAGGLECQWWSTDYGDETKTNVFDNGTISYTPRFKSSGTKVIRLTVKDKDADTGNGTTIKTWYYEVEPSKTLKTVALGPSRGTGNSLVSQRYAAAAGIGEGHVFADAAFAGASKYVLSWNCGTALAVNFWAWGYKNGAVDNGGLNSTKVYDYDVPLDMYGNNAGDGKSALSSYHTYTPNDDCDSFFYGLLFTTIDEGSASVSSALSGSTVAPEITGREIEVPTLWIPLPDTTAGESGKYVDTVVEAIFAKEYETTDNMGDIDQDGLPDHFAVAKIWKTGSPLVAMDGVGSELGNGAGLNDDGDYLPTEAQLTSGATISTAGWDSSGQPFTARLEARGFHRGLNFGMFPITDGDGWVSDIDMSDAEKKALIEYAKADTKNVAEATALTNSVTTVSAWLVLPDDYTAAQYDTYTNEQAIAKAYISKTWKGYNKFNTSKWGFTVENRTDPTQWDTDGDNIPDGYEYYYWYAATVGYDDAGTPMTGEKFNLEDVESPIPIASADIAALMNPNIAADYQWGKQDSDEDGLSDYEEYVLGTNPFKWDTDGDKVSDLYEVLYGIDPLANNSNANNGDYNGDGDFMAKADLGTFTIYTYGGKSYAYKIGLVVPNMPGPGTNTLTGVGFEVAAFNDGYMPVSPTFTESDELATIAPYVWDTADASVTPGVATGTVSLYHYQVYNYYGFSPRTGWRGAWSNGTLSPTGRWLENGSPLTAGTPDNTQPYTALNEFRLVKYRYITGFANYANDKKAIDDADDKVQKRTDILIARTTNGGVALDEKAVGERTFAAKVHGADTDSDGVPDGWELYVGVDPNIPYTDTEHETLYNAIRQLDAGDGLALAAEFAGTDSTLGYQACETIYANHPDNESGCMYHWYNKFFPTDPRSSDTDGDGVEDSVEHTDWSRPWTYNRWANGKTAKIDGKGIQAHHKTIYGNPYDAGTRHIRGGGCNPCSIDTDEDGLPDAWEHQYAGVVFQGGDIAEDSLTTEGTIDPSFYDDIRAAASAYNVGSNTYYVCMGQDGTYPDAFTDVSRGLNSADWDGDGLENGQEYMIQAMRHLRYDDSITPLMGRDSAAFNSATGKVEPGAWNGEGGTSGDSGFVSVPLGEELEDGELETLEKLGYGNFAAYVRRHPNYLRTLGYFAAPPKSWDPAGSEGFGYRYMLPPTAVRMFARTVNYQNQYTNSVGHTLWAYPDRAKWDPDVAYDSWSTNSLAGYVITNSAPDETPLYDLSVYTAADQDRIVYSINDDGVTRYYHVINVEIPNPATTNIFTDLVYRLFESGVTTNSVTTNIAASAYVSTDPRLWDTDEDGMDDYYEMFHGLNPLLGSIGTIERTDLTNTVAGVDTVMTNVYQSGASDVIWAAYGYSPVSVIRNAWIGWEYENEPRYDALKYPWMMGAGLADADGDGLRNEEEALFANLASPTTAHTDPTPIWMTDTTVGSTSYVYSVTYPVTNYMYQADGVTPQTLYDPSTKTRVPVYSNIVEFTETKGMFRIYKSPSYTAQYYDAPWYGALGFNSGYAFDFEQNEGYDTDFDKRSDSIERRNLTESSSDPLDFTDPTRRQSIHFGGDGDEGVAVTYNPVTRPTYASNADFLKQFTVEAWVLPENLSVAHEQYLVSRAANYGGWTLNYSNDVIRTSFAIGITADGYPFAEIEDTTRAKERVYSTKPFTLNTWAHIAATYDGETFVIYFNGEKAGENKTSIIPATGVTDVEQDPQTSHNAYFPVVDYATVPSATLVGAKANGPGAFGHAAAAEITVWTDLATDFFKGSISEVRIWDGARTGEEIAGAYTKAFTSDEIDAMRRDIYAQYEGLTARRNDNTAHRVLPAELVQHYNFSTIGGAVTNTNVQIVPAGFVTNVLNEVCNNGAPLNNKYLVVGWWSEMLDNAVLKKSVYASPHVVPWLGNTVGHMPRLSGAVADSVFWSERYAGWTPASFQGLEKFEFPNTMNPYNIVYSRSSGSRSQKDQSLIYKTQILRAQNPESEDCEEFWTANLYDLRREFPGTSDLLPLGSAYAERKTTYWDSQGPEDAWAVTRNGEAYDGDPNDDSVPNWVNTVTYSTTREYARGLAKGLLPDGVEHPEYENTADLDGDGLRDWWEKFFGIYDEGPNDDHDRDGLSNYQEYLIGEVYTSFGFGELSPVAAYSKGTSVTDYFLRYNSLYLGELFSDHDMIEDEFEDYMPSVTSLGGTLVSNFSRWIYDADWDAERDGWDNWSIARAWFNESYVSNVVTEVGGVAVTNEYLFSKLDDNNGNPSPKINIYLSYKYTGRCPEIGSPTKSHQFVIKAWNLENGKADKGFVSPDCTWGGKLEGEGGYFTLTGTANGYFASQGAVKPGRNMFVAYIAEGDFEEGGTAPSYQPGMPYGVAYGVEVGSIGSGTVNIELTDTNPSVVRIDIPAAVALVYGGGNQTVASGSTLAETLFEEIAKGYTDRGRHEPDMLRIPDYIGEDTKLTVSNIHVRILRAGMNGEQETNGGLPLSRKDVLLDRNFRIGVNHVLTEADLLASLPSGEGDLDWGLPQYNNMSTKDFTNAVYRVVVGDGTVSGDEDNNNLIVMFYNKFELGTTQTAVSNMTCRTFAGRPTFSWTHANTISKDYPAFRLRVWDGGTPIYDSGVQRAPVRDQAGYYNWAPPLYVGEMLSNDKVFEPNKDYKWSVSMLDAKFTSPLANEEQKTFKMQETSSGPGSDDYGIIKVVVKYMGPGAVSTNKAANCIRVEAFTTPDFTGEPAGVGFVTDATTINSTTNLDINATIVGLPQKTGKGRTVQYYVRAFLDTDVISAEGGYGERAPWESWGYASYRDPKQDRYDCFTPCAITATNYEKAEPCVVFIEDCDTNRNMVPDILETTAAGATTLYSPYIAYTASDAVKTNALVAATNGANGDKDSVKRTRALLAFASAVEAAESGTVTAGELAVLYGGISFETVDSANIKITSFSLDDGISLEVNIEGTFAGAVSAGYDTGLINVTVEYSKTLENGGVWQRAGDVVTLSFSLTQPTTKIEATELVAIKDAIKNAKDDGGCYFRVSAVAFER